MTNTLERSTQRSRPTSWRQTLLDNPDLFLAHYFSERLGLGLQDFHLRLIEAALTKPRALILFPAGHGKTTLISELLPIWALCRDPNVRVGIIAKNDEERDGIMRSIQRELSANNTLIEDFGPFKHESAEWAWSLSRLSVAKRTRGGKSDTIAAFGAGARTTLGYRTDWTICDDVVTAENSATPEQRSKLRTWFNKSVATMPESYDGRITVVGTRFEPDDLYADIEELRSPDTDERIYWKQQEDAVVSEEEKISLWPKQWPWPRLMEKKAELGVLDFDKRYRNIAVDQSRQIFKEEYIRGGWIHDEQYPGCIDRDYTIDNKDPSWPVFCGFDPAIGTKKAKFSALITIALGSCAEHETCYWVLDLVRGQMTAPQQRDLILSKCEKYNPSVCMVEANGYQAGLHQIIKETMEKQGFAYRVEPHFTHRRNKPDPELGVGSMKAWFMNGRVHIPIGDHASRDMTRIFVEELVSYPGRTTDTVMAFWFAWRASQQFAQLNSVTFNRLSQNKSPVVRRALGRGRVVRNPFYAMEEDESDE